MSAGVTAIFQLSDESYKKDIRPTVRCGVDAILALPVKDYRRTHKGAVGPVQTGFVAQDIEETMPETVCKIDGIKSVSPGMFMPMVVKAIQEHENYLILLAARVEQLEEHGRRSAVH